MRIEYKICEEWYGWYWIILGTDNRLSAESGRHYTRRSDAERALKRFVKRMSQPHTLKLAEW